MRITNAQKKELSDIVIVNGLKIIDFNTSGDNQNFEVKYKHDYYSFSISLQNPGSYYLTIFSVDNTNGYSLSGKWDRTLFYFKNWAREIFEELTTPTGWNTFENENYLNTNIEDIEEKFSDTDKILVLQGIDELKERISQLDLPNESIKMIDRKLDDLKIKVDELSKFDWKSLLIGTLVSLILSLSLPPELNGTIWYFVSQSFNNPKQLR